MPTQHISSAISRRGFIAASLAWATSARAADFRDIAWEDLIPKGWDPMKSIKNPGALSDGDPRAQAMYEQLREIWDNAPTVAAMAGQAIRLPGYVVPLDESRDGLREFLLVPYFGACIHTPPPPSNQIVHVRTQAAVKGFRTMDAVWASGTLAVERASSNMGVSGYTMIASRVVAYVRK